MLCPHNVTASRVELRALLTPHGIPIKLLLCLADAVRLVALTIEAMEFALTVP